MLEDKLIIWEFNRGNRGILRRIYEKYKKDLMALVTVKSQSNISRKQRLAKGYI